MIDERYVEEELAKAQQALNDAEQLASGGSDEGVVNRLYYAAFHAAQAALYDRGIEPSSHVAIRTGSVKRSCSTDPWTGVRVGSSRRSRISVSRPTTGTNRSTPTSPRYSIGPDRSSNRWPLSSIRSPGSRVRAPERGTFDGPPL